MNRVKRRHLEERECGCGDNTPHSEQTLRNNCLLESDQGGIGVDGDLGKALS